MGILKAMILGISLLGFSCAQEEEEVIEVIEEPQPSEKENTTKGKAQPAPNPVSTPATSPTGGNGTQGLPEDPSYDDGSENAIPPQQTGTESGDSNPPGNSGGNDETGTGNTPSTGTGNEELELEATYEGGIATLIQKNCVGCHNSSNTARVDLSTYTALQQGAAASLARMEDGSMPPSSPMQQSELDLFATLINEGYQ